MRRIAVALAFASLVALAFSAAAHAAFSIKSLDVTFEEEDGSPATQAGSHPFAVTSDINFSTKEGPGGKAVPDGSPKDVIVSLPPGLVGDREAVPRCPDADFLLVSAGENEFSACPDESVVGVLRVRTPGETTGGDIGPAFNLAPPPGAAAKIGFILLHVPVALLVRVSPEAPHNLIATIQNTSDIEPIGGAELTIWGNPAAEVHDDERGPCVDPAIDDCEVDIPEKPFLTLPRSCEGPQFTSYRANSWEEPGTFVTGTSSTPLQTTGCEQLELKPTVSARPTTDRAESPSGLAFDLDIDDKGLQEVGKVAQTDLRRTVVTLPEGMTLSPPPRSGSKAARQPSSPWRHWPPGRGRDAPKPPKSEGLKQKPRS